MLSVPCLPPFCILGSSSSSSALRLRILFEKVKIKMPSSASDLNERSRPQARSLHTSTQHRLSFSDTKTLLSKETLTSLLVHSLVHSNYQLFRPLNPLNFDLKQTNRKHESCTRLVTCESLGRRSASDLRVFAATATRFGDMLLQPCCRASWCLAVVFPALPPGGASVRDARGPS